jgi:hypothetical protein
VLPAGFGLAVCSALAWACAPVEAGGLQDGRGIGHKHGGREKGDNI